MASSWERLGQAASVMQVTGVDAFSLVSMIVQAAHTARRNRDLCHQLAQHVLIVDGLLRELEIPALMQHQVTRRPLDQLSDSLFRAYKLVRSCTEQQEKTSQIYQMFTGTGVSSKLRQAQEEIDRFIILIPMITLAAAVGAQQDVMSKDAAPPRRNRFSLRQVTESLTLEESPPQQVNSYEMRSISERIPGSPLRVPASPSRFSWSSSPPSINEPLNFSLEHVVKLTHNFAPALMIGEGYFGKVYRATLPDGRVIAIKRAKKENFVSLRAEFSSEGALLKNIEHKNLVQVLGYIDKANERILITEYVSNGTLREHLDGEHGLVLGFNQRLEIAIDVAHGLTYLHLYAEKPIIHRDVKSSNILLTEGFVAKLADFGSARTGPTEPDQSQNQTVVRGTAGYVDPEYLRSNCLTIKSDVFSYGILLLEILSGRRPIDARRGPTERITVKWAFNKYHRGSVSDILDPMLTEAVNEDILNKIFDVAFQCVAPSEVRLSMKEVVERLWKIRRDYTNIQRIAKSTL